MSRAARRLCPPAHCSIKERASSRRVFCACGLALMGLCICIECIYMQGQLPMNDVAYGLATSAQIAGMTGKQILQAIIDGELPAPPIAQTLSFRLTEVGDGFAAFEGEPGPHLLNPMGGVHGGWALTLIDSAAGCAGQTLLPAGSGYATVETKANFSRP